MMVVGFCRSVAWSRRVTGKLGGSRARRIGSAVVAACVAGALLPLIMQCVGSSPAASSAPFVATLVDGTGLVIYFTVAAALLKGTLL